MIAVCGEALMDVFAGTPTPTGLALDARVGGSPFNLAVGLARLRQPVALLGAISTDFLGQRLWQALVDEGVEPGAVRRSAAPTTLSLVGTDSGGHPSYAFHGSAGADRDLPLDALAALDALPNALRALHLGSYTAIVPQVASTLRALVERMQHRCLIAYDPNLRLQVEPDRTRWRAMLDWMLPRADLVKLSDEDLRLLEPGLPIEIFARHARAQGCGLLIVTRGAHGALAWSRHAHAAAPAQPVALVDTVGAGDSFQAATLAWLAEHACLSAGAPGGLDADALHALLRFATAAAALTCGRRGADLPRRDAIDAALRGA